MQRKLGSTPSIGSLGVADANRSARIKSVNHAEVVAKTLIEQIVQGSRMEHRTDQSQGQHDFDLHCADGQIFAFEVTAAMDEVLTRTNAEIRNRRRGGFFVAAKLSKNGWLIHPDRGAPIRDIREKADWYLSKVEEACLDSFSSHRLNHPSVERICRDLRISEGSVCNWKEPGLIGLARPGSGGRVEPLAAINAAIHEGGLTVLP